MYFCGMKRMNVFFASQRGTSRPYKETITVFRLWLMLSLSLLCVMLLTTACGGKSDDETLSRQEQQRLQREEQQALKVAVMPTLDCLPMFLAKDMGLFDTLKVDVRLKMYAAQMDIDTALLRNRVEIGVTDRVRLERIMKAGAKLTELTALPSTWTLVSNKDARLKNVNQLGDKMVAMTRFSATDMLTDKSLEGVKTKAQVFRVQINDVGLRLRMILGGTMDAAWLPEPQATQAVADGHVLMARSGDIDTNLGRMVCRTEEMAEARRSQQFNLFMKAYNQAVDSVNRYGAGHYADVVKRWCEVDDKAVKKMPSVKFEKINE